MNPPTFPSSEPTGFTTQNIFGLSNNHSASGRAFIVKDALLFKFYNFLSNDGRIDIELVDDAGNGRLTHESIEVPSRSGDLFVLFEDFPVSPSGDKPGVCAYELKLTNETRGSSATSVGVRIFRRQ
jgi:hypothetical protein